MQKGETVQEYHLEGEGRISPEKTLVRIVNKTGEIAHNSGGSTINNNTICNKGGDPLGGTCPGRKRSYYAGFIHGLIA